MDKIIQINTTFSRREDAIRAAKLLVEKSLAGCVQIVGPIVSIYRWKGEVETEEEWLCLIKSTETLFKHVEEAIKSVHPYEVPEIVAIPIISGSKEYLDWLHGSLEKERSNNK
ncbi:MAG: divalent-cation tolerance protein CutA [Nitrososphaerota archaeon]|nr:divalent-cation tolerance protein CutA [Candidatus Bathyarchaeota archaeon]MDW8048629.1 divalent-cation tolerance protein CutA [Nitrososphaerota archaeon]